MMHDTKQKAAEISKIILSVDTDYRGNLFLEIASYLRHEAQGYTGKIMETAANNYGVNPNDQQT